MSSAHSVTHWLGELKSNNPDAAQRLWELYFHRLMALARKRLRGARRRAADEQDVALSALDSFFRGVKRGRFPELDDRDNLWRILAIITERKAHDLITKEKRKKRGGGNERGESVFDDGKGLGEFVGKDPSPDVVVEMAEQCRRLLDMLGDDVLKRVALLSLEGWTNAEIADKIDRDEKTVERKLRMIRKVWKTENAQ
jgi:DNA-directed RNA polymerase specialized sigma24 family protein